MAWGDRSLHVAIVFRFGFCPLWGTWATLLEGSGSFDQPKARRALQPPGSGLGDFMEDAVDMHQTFQTCTPHDFHSEVRSDFVDLRVPRRPPPAAPRTPTLKATPKAKAK